MRSRIAGRLLGYFAAALLLFSILLGGTFAFLFYNHTLDQHKEDLERQADNIAAALSGNWEEIAGLDPNHPRWEQLDIYLELLDTLTLGDVWVVDARSRVINRSIAHEEMSYSELPPDAEALIEQALKGKTSFSYSFSTLLGERSATIGVPFTNKDGWAVGVVLLHSPVDGIRPAVAEGLKTMAFSLMAALLIAAIASLHLSLHFSRPLEQMKGVALRLAEGDYSAKNRMRYKDEIGQLADTMDLLADRLQDATEKSEQLEQMRRSFISNISHELRTPVTVLRCSLEALCDGVVTEPPQVEEYHRQMMNESIHLQHLVNDLLDLSRLQSMDFRIEMEPFPLRGLLEDVTRSMRQLSGQKVVELSLSCELAELVVIGDYSRIRQMLLIVTDNAVKFSPEGQSVALRLWMERERGAVSVRDRGRGISPEALPYIFDRFYKNDDDPGHNGTGLGLAIAKQIADRHGVEIRVESDADGTVFTFLFPPAAQG